jgi:hypothetical protein
MTRIADRTWFNACPPNGSLSPIAAGVHLLPMTAMLIVGSPLAGTLISRIGPRLPITGRREHQRCL